MITNWGAGCHNKTTDTHITLYIVPKGPKMHMAYPFWSLVPVVGVLGPNQ